MLSGQRPRGETATLLRQESRGQTRDTGVVRFRLIAHRSYKGPRQAAVVLDILGHANIAVTQNFMGRASGCDFCSRAMSTRLL